MMNRLENAARQALEALEDLQKYGVKQSRALFALREALAQQQQAAEPVAQKPYAYEYGVDNGDGTYSIQIDRGSLIHTGVQYEYCAPRNPHPEHPVKPLYTHPAPTQQPLTDDELRNVLRNTNHMIRNAMHGSFWPELEQACRAIEAAHGITSKKGGAA